MRTVKLHQFHSQLFRHQRRDPVLETLPLLVGEGQVVRIGADAKRLRLFRLRGQRDAGSQPEQATDAARNALHDISSVDGRKTGASREAGTGPMDTTICYRDATFWLRPKTVSTPPWVLNLSASP